MSTVYQLYVCVCLSRVADGTRDRLEIFAFFMLTGIFSTLLIKETKLQSLEELSNEKQDGFIEG